MSVLSSGNATSRGYEDILVKSAKSITICFGGVRVSHILSITEEHLHSVGVHNLIVLYYILQSW